MKISILLFAITFSFAVNAQKTVYFKQFSKGLFEDIQGHYPVSKTEALGNAHYEFTYNKLNKLEKVRGFGQGETIFNDSTAEAKGLYRVVYVNDTSYTMTLTAEENKLTDVKILENIAIGEYSVTKHIYKNGVIIRLINLNSLNYAKNYSGEVEETDYNEEGEIIENSEEVVEPIDSSAEEGAKIEEDKEAIKKIPVGYEYEKIQNTGKTKLFILNLDFERISIEGLHSILIDFDKISNTYTISYFNETGERIDNANASWEMILDYTKEGMLEYVLEKKKDGSLISENNQTPFVNVFGYNQWGYSNSITRCDVNLKPIEITNSNVGYNEETGEEELIQTTDYTTLSNLIDKNGNVIETFKYNYKKELIANEDGSFGTCFTYDKLGNLNNTSYLDKNRQPMEIEVDGLKFAGTRSSYDVKTSTTETSFVDVNNQLIKNKQGVYVTRSINTPDGFTDLTEFLDINGKPMEDNSGAHSYTKVQIYETSASDEELQLAEVRNAKNELIGMENAYSKEEMGYEAFTRKTMNKDGKLMTEKFFDKNHNKYQQEYGSHEVRYTYHADGSIKTTIFFDKEGQPSNNMGDHKIETSRETSGNIVKVTTTRTREDGSLSDEYNYPITIEEYDATTGEFLSTGSLDGTRQPILNGEIWKTVTIQNMATGTYTDSYFKYDGSPAKNDDGIHKVVTENTTSQNSTTFFDAKGKMTNSINGYAKEIQLLNENGSIKEIAYFNKKGKKASHKINKFHKALITFDEAENITLVELKNKRGKATDGYIYYFRESDIRAAKMEVVYMLDENDGYQRLSETYFSRKNKMVKLNTDFESELLTPSGE